MGESLPHKGAAGQPRLTRTATAAGAGSKNEPNAMINSGCLSLPPSSTVDMLTAKLDDTTEPAIGRVPRVLGAMSSLRGFRYLPFDHFSQGEILFAFWIASFEYRESRPTKSYRGVRYLNSSA